MTLSYIIFSNSGLSIGKVLTDHEVQTPDISGSHIIYSSSFIRLSFKTS